MNSLVHTIGKSHEPISRPPRVLGFLAYTQMGLLDVTSPQTAFWAASKAMTERGLKGYTLHAARMEGGLIPRAGGLIVHTISLDLTNRVTVDTLIVPGAPDIRQAMIDIAALVRWLRTASI